MSQETEVPADEKASSSAAAPGTATVTAAPGTADKPPVSVVLPYATPTSPANQSDGAVAATIDELPAADGADVLEHLSSAKAADVAEYLDPDTAAAAIAEMDPVLAASVIADMEAPEAALVLEAMDPDDRVDLLAHVSKEKHAAIMAEMDAAQVADIRALEKYPSRTAGGMMTSQVTALYERITVDNAITLLRRLNEELEQMFYVYVINRQGHLTGVLSMRDLILAKPTSTLSKIMIRNVRSVPATMPQEEVSKLMRRYGYLAMPVVDDQKRLVGLITLDDVVDIIQREATEDMQKMFGAGAEERLTSPWQFSLKKRIWWLEVNLATAFMAAGIVSLFTNTIAAVPILAAYQTIVSGMGGNAGAQAMAVSIRGIALGEVDRSLLKKILYREFLVGLFSGLSIGVTTGLIATVFNYTHHGFVLGLIIFLALTLNHVNACLTGVSIPFVMKKLGFDPAQSATIFATTFTDCGGFFACLGLAKMFMPWLTG
jgi:magnesium transporter